MDKKQLPVDELEFGMYVAELDRPWTETPFMFQGFHLRTDPQLSALKKHCRHVFIDLERSERPDARPPAAQFKIRGSTAYPETTTVEVEFKEARSVYTETADS